MRETWSDSAHIKVYEKGGSQTKRWECL